jgi:chorismate dehydratase
LRKPRVCAVSYLNTVPLVWGMLHGEQKGIFDLTFRVPAGCADMLAAGEADIGLLPAFELLHGCFETAPGLGIACRGTVRSILLVTKAPPYRIRTLAADSSSRTSVELARVVLARRYGAYPAIASHAPDLGAMLRTSDAALLIGDPALHLNPAALPYRVLDLGEEWTAMTGLPMVFAVWAARPGAFTPALAEAFRLSCRFGLERMEDIVRAESEPRGFEAETVRRYLTRNIVHELGSAEEEGMRLFLRYAGQRAAGCAR